MLKLKCYCKNMVTEITTHMLMLIFLCLYLPTASIMVFKFGYCLGMFLRSNSCFHATYRAFINCFSSSSGVKTGYFHIW